MIPAIAHHDATVYLGDARTVLEGLPSGSVQCIVTSPPYYGLRDYGTGTWEGGDPDCDHAMPVSGSHLNANFNERWGNSSGQRKQETAKVQQFRDVCGQCGARRVDHQLGLEASPAEYVAGMVAVFAEARRVLAADGVLWLNLGDSYAQSQTASGTAATSTTLGIRADGTAAMGPAGRARAQARQRVATSRKLAPDVGPKNLLGIPWRVAFALQDDGWTLRNAVIWAKPNAMPESVTDRLSTRYEHVFLFSKSRRYWFDLDPIREPHTSADDPRWLRATQPGNPHRNDGGMAMWREGKEPNPLGRNPGDVWTIPTTPYPGAHFACMPPELARRCILAGCPERVCRECGHTPTRITEAGDLVSSCPARPNARLMSQANAGDDGGALTARDFGCGSHAMPRRERTVTGWTDCGHNAYSPGVVLDPFTGSGTTAMVARQLGRRFVGAELNPSYIPLIEKRIGQEPFDFGEALA